MHGVLRRWASLLLTLVLAIPVLWHPAPAAGSAAAPDPQGEVTLYTAGVSGNPRNIAAGPDGNMWFTFLATVATPAGIGKITPTGEVTEYTAGISNPIDIAAGPDGNMWFTGSGTVGKITPAGAVTTFQAVGLDLSHDGSIAAGPDGNMWFTERQSIARITPDGVVTQYPVQVGYRPHGIAAGPDGNMWFNEVPASSDGPGYIGQITPAGAVTEFEVVTSDSPTLLWIAAGPDGNMWFTLYGRPPGGKITPAGAVTLFPVAYFSNFGATRQIAAGPDGNMWVLGEPALDDTGRIGSLTMAGEFTEYAGAVPALHAPTDIAAGPDGNMWFPYWSFEPGASRGGIGKIGTASEVGPVDANGDGVEDVLQPSGTTTGAFIDPTLSPETIGSIVSMDAGVSVSVVDAVNPDGVEIKVSGPAGARATLSLCGFAAVQLSVGSDLVVTCHSLGMQVVAGSAVVVLNASTRLRVPAGVTVEVTATVDGYTVVSQGGAVTVTTNGVDTVIGEGSFTILSYTFSGFFSPVDNLPVVNVAKGGTAIPVKFGLGGDRGLNIFATGYPKSQQVECSATDPVDGIEKTASPGAATLSFSSSSATYEYVWKTDKAWAGTCRQFVLKLLDGTSYRATFKFK